MFSPRASFSFRWWQRSMLSWTAWPLCWLGVAAVQGEEPVSYQDHVRPIFESACNNCHNADKKKGGLDLTSYAALMAGGSSGEVVVPGAATDSRLFACISRTAEPVMPPQGDPLPSEQVEIIRKWIDGGLLDAKGGVAKKPKKPTLSLQVGEVAMGRPEGPPPMPEHLLLEPVVVTPRPGAVGAMASSPWAPVVALAGQRQVLLYNSDTLELAGILPVEEGGIDSLIFSRNGQLVIAGTGRAGKSGRLQAWEVKTGKVAFVLGEERDAVLAADVSADMYRAALGGPLRRVKLYDPSTGELVKDIKKHTDWVTALQFSPDGVLLASGDRAGGLHVWEAATGTEFYTLAGHTKAITAVAWRADGNVLASASEDGTIRLWEMNEGKEVKKWDAHRGGVLSLAFTHDGRLVSCGRDNHAKVWKLDGSLVTSVNKFNDLPLSVTFTHDGQRFVVGDWSGRVSVWNSADAQPVGELSAAPPSLEQRVAALRPELEKAQQAAQQAKAAWEEVQAQLTAAQNRARALRQQGEAYTQQIDAVEARLRLVREQGEALLEVLERSEAAPAEGPATLDLAASEAFFREVKASGRDLDLAWPRLAASAAEVVVTLPKMREAQTRELLTCQAEVAQREAQAATAQEALAAAQAQVAQCEQILAKWQAAQVNVRVHQQRQLVEELTAKLEELTAAIAEAEATSQAVTAGGANTVNEAAQTLSQLRGQYAALEAQLTEARQQLEEQTQVFLSLLPK